MFKLTESQKADIQRIGISVLQRWLTENEIKLPGTKNFYSTIENGINEKNFSIDQLINALCELEENGDKRIHLYQIRNLDDQDLKKSIVVLTKKLGSPQDKNYSIRKTPTEGSTFNYWYHQGSIIKIKFSEKQYDSEVDYVAQKIVKIPRTVVIVIIIDFEQGDVQIRYDNPGTLHKHTNAKKKPVESIYKQFYFDKLVDLLPDFVFENWDLSKVTKSILTNPDIPYRINKNHCTLPDGVKQTYSAAADIEVRENSVVKTILPNAKNWLAEDLSGYWKADASEKRLAADLFMRISQKDSEIRVQRGCLEKEINYGIAKIREIQTAV